MATNPFDVLTTMPAQVGVTITSTGPLYEGATGAAGPVSMLRDVTFTVDANPAEMDMPSGTFWIWPVKRGQLQFTGLVKPGGYPMPIKNGPTGPDYKDIEIRWTGPTPNSSPVTYRMTGADVKAILTGLTLQTQRIGENMPVLQETSIWDVFQETDPTYTIP